LPHSSPSGRRNFADLVRAWLAATLLSGLPSTAWALATGGDVTEATRAAGAMLLPHETSTAKLVAAVLIALLDLKVIAPLFFPQVADHLMWGAAFGIALRWRRTL
jgi:hypothetical protein